MLTPDATPERTVDGTASCSSFDRVEAGEDGDHSHHDLRRHDQRGRGASRQHQPGRRQRTVPAATTRGKSGSSIRPASAPAKPNAAINAAQ